MKEDCVAVGKSSYPVGHLPTYPYFREMAGGALTHSLTHLPINLGKRRWGTYPLTQLTHLPTYSLTQLTHLPTYPTYSLTHAFWVGKSDHLPSYPPILRLYLPTYRRAKRAEKNCTLLTHLPTDFRDLLTHLPLFFEILRFTYPLTLILGDFAQLTHLPLFF